MVLGEIGNFSAYGFSPASLVAPLGTTTVIGMCLDIFLICIICRAVYNSWQPVYFHTTALYLLLFIRRKVWHLICARGLEFCLRSTAKGPNSRPRVHFSIQGPTQTSKKLICCSVSLLFSALPQIARQKFWIQPLYKSQKGFDTGLATQIQEFKSLAHQNTSVKKIYIIFI